MSKFPTILCLVALTLSPVLAVDLKDPMAPFTAPTPGAESKTNELVLSGIIIGAQRRIAIINDQPFRVGSEVGRYQLTAINKSSVEITSDGSTRKLQLRESVRNSDEIE